MKDLVRATVALLSVVMACNLRAQADHRPGVVASRPASGRCVETEQGWMVPYTAPIPGTDSTFEMVPIPGGTFRITVSVGGGDDAQSKGRTTEIRVRPFWMGKYEVTWSEFRHYMKLHSIFHEFARHRMRQVTAANRADAVTAPSEVYDISFAHQSGADARLPAVTMTQFGAKQYTCWLSKLTTQQYRLPTEIEWEYACRAGATTPFHFGSRREQLQDYAWYFGNSQERAHVVGQKKPNAWGLHDMHGNVWEWVVDRYSREPFQGFTGAERDVMEAVRWPTTRSSMTARGGSWDAFSRDCRARSRLRSEEEGWKRQDPMLPRSPWWFTDSPADTIGFRIVRSLTPLSAKQIRNFWNSTVPQEAVEIKVKVAEGRGTVGIVDDKLPQSLQQLDRKK